MRHLDTIDFAYLSVLRAYDGSPAQEVAREMGYDEEFLRRHAEMPYCMQVRVGSDDNFVPYEVLKRARLEIALSLYSAPRMRRVLARLRRVLDEEEIVMKLASYLSNTRDAARRMVRSYDTIGGRAGSEAVEPEPSG